MLKLTKTEVAQRFKFAMRNPELSKDPSADNYVVDVVAVELMGSYEKISLNEAYIAIYAYTDAMRLEQKANPDINDDDEIQRSIAFD